MGNQTFDGTLWLPNFLVGGGGVYGTKCGPSMVWFNTFFTVSSEKEKLHTKCFCIVSYFIDLLFACKVSLSAFKGAYISIFV